MNELFKQYGAPAALLVLLGGAEAQDRLTRPDVSMVSEDLTRRVEVLEARDREDYGAAQRIEGEVQSIRSEVKEQRVLLIDILKEVKK